MISREKAMELMKCEYLYSSMEHAFPLIHAFGKKADIGPTNKILSWSQIIDWMNGGIKQRGEEFAFDIGPSRQVVDRNFSIGMRMYLSTNDESSNDRICLKFEIFDHKTEWKQVKNFYWQNDKDIATAYYALQFAVHELSETALEKGKHEIKMTPKLHKEILEILKFAGLE
jgi:hypothetical protein